MEKENTKIKHKRDFENMSDVQILNVVLEDYQATKTFQQPFFDKFVEYYKLYRSYIEEANKRPNGSNLFIPYAFHIIETIVAKLVNAMFYARPYVQTVPLGVDDGDLRNEKAKKMNKLLDYQFFQKMDMMHIASDTIKTALLYGTAVTKQTWDYEEKEVVKRVPKEVLGIKLKNLFEEQKKKEIVKDYPKMTLVPILDFFFDPASTDIDSGRYCIHRYSEDLDVLKSQSEKTGGKYKNLDKLEESTGAPSATVDLLASIGVSGTANRKKGIEILEYWTDDWVVKVANNEVVIMSQPNPFHHRKKPFAKWIDTPVPNEFYGIGEIEPIVYLQHELNTTRNQRIDNVSFALNRMWKKVRGANISPDQLVSRPNGIIEVDDMNDLDEIQFTPVTVGYEEEQVIKSDIDRTTGVFDSARGSNPVRRETATTMSILANASSERFQIKVMLLSEGGFKEAVQQIIQLNQQFIDRNMEMIILGEDGTQEITELSPTDIIGEYDIVAVGSAVEPSLNKEVKQNQMIQLLNVINQNPYVNQEAFLRRLFEAFDMKNIDELLAQPEMMPEFPGMEQEPPMGGLPIGGGLFG